MTAMPTLPSAVQAQLDKAKAALMDAEKQSQSAQTQPAPQEPQKPQEPANSGEQPKLKNTGNPPTQEPENADYYKHKYDVINGKYVKETSDLRAEIERLNEQMKELNQRKPVQDQTKRVKPADITDEEIEENFSSDDIEELGYSVLKSLLATTKNTVLTAAPAVESTSAKRVEELEAEFKKQQEDAFYKELTRLVPNWDQIQSQPEWDQFLKQEEGNTDISRGSFLSDAAERFDAQRVAKFFRTYISMKGSSGFDGLVSPTTYVPSEVQTPGTTITFQEYMSRLENLPKLGLSPAEMQKREAELNAMMRQGKVTGVPRSG